MRKRYFGLLAAMAAMLVLAGGYQISKADPAHTGKIDVKILKDNHPVANAHVRLFVADHESHHHGHESAHQATDNMEHNDKHKDEKPVAKGTTNADGTYTFENVAPGKYIVRAGMKDEGMAREHVTVTADKTAEVTLNLKMHGDKDHK